MERNIGKTSERSGEGSANEPGAGSERVKTPKGVVLLCDLCGNVMYERHCRIVCPACGYQRDCSDP